MPYSLNLNNGFSPVPKVQYRCFNRKQIMKFKILGVLIAATGFLLVAKYNDYIIGLILLFIGFFVAMKMGMKPE